MSRIELWAATPTPFDPRGRLNLEVVPEQAARLRADDADGAFITGTTGEFPSLSADERHQMIDAWAQARPEGFGLAVHVGSSDPRLAAELAAHAERAGADFIASVASYYGEPDIDASVRQLAHVAAAAPATPMCYYHIPSMTGLSYRVSDVLTRALPEIPTLQGVKFTDDDLIEFETAGTMGPDLRMYFGRDELLPASLSFGATAFIGSLYNGLTPLARQVVVAFEAGEHERAFALHRPFREIAAVSGHHGGLGFVKELMNRLGPDTGAPRIPWGALGQSDLATADALLPSLRSALAEAKTTGGMAT